MTMRFADPIFLPIFAAACVALLLLFWGAARARRRALEELATARLIPELTRSLSPARRATKHALLLSGTALLGLALARPQFGYRTEEAHRRGIDLLFAI